MDGEELSLGAEELSLGAEETLGALLSEGIEEGVVLGIELNDG